MTEDGVPGVGVAVHDSGSGRVGLVAGHRSPHVLLRPLGGGRDWEADPGHLRPLSRAEFLSAQLAEVNARSRHPRPC
ncbi:hypothetical protein [Streptomyces anulatus]|uniref:hypothetical protein n=1 Tax=Streptomyces anulatus TaxID=1892 RepID=UPI003869DB49|nr:hypothetical protein OG575_09625 [Streptomyces anulatus]